MPMTEVISEIRLAQQEERLLDMQKPMSICNAIICSLYKSNTGCFVDPETDKLYNITNALSSKTNLLEPESAVIIDPTTKTAMTFSKALKTELLDASGQIHIGDDIILPLDVAYRLGYIVSVITPMSFADVIRLGLYNHNTGMIRFNDTDEHTLQSACNLNLIKADEHIIFDSADKAYSLTNAIRSGLIDSKIGTYNTAYGARINLDTAFENGYIRTPSTQLSLIDCIKSPVWNAITCHLQLSPTSECTLREALTRGIVHGRRCFFYDETEKLCYPLQRAIDRGSLDLVSGTCYVGTSGRKLQLPTACEEGILQQHAPNMRLEQAIRNKLILDGSSMVLETASGTYTNLNTAMKRNSLSVDSFMYLNKQQPVTLSEAVKLKIAEKSTCNPFLNGRPVAICNAWKRKLVVPKRFPVTLSTCIRERHTSPQSGMLSSPYSAQPVTITTAIKQKLICSNLPAVVTCGRILTVSQALAENCLKRDDLTVQKSKTEVCSATDALKKGLIVDNTHRWTLYDAIKSGLLDKCTNRFSHPSITRKLTLHQALAVDLIADNDSAVFDEHAGRYVILSEAIQKRLVDPHNNAIRQEGRPSNRLKDALNLRLVAPTKKPMSLPMLIESHLFNVTTQKIVDPTSNNTYDIRQAITVGLLDGSATVYVVPKESTVLSLPECIQKGMLSDDATHITHDKVPIAISDAVQRGILRSCSAVPTFTQAINNGMLKMGKHTFIDDRLKKPVDLDTAVKRGLIDISDTFAKSTSDTKGTSAYISLKTALRIKETDLVQRVSIDHKSGQWHPLVLKFDNGIIEFSRRTFSFEFLLESGCISLSSGLFHDPRCPQQWMTFEKIVRLNIIDGTSALVVNTEESQLLRLEDAAESKLIVDSTILNTTTKQKLSIMDALTHRLIRLPSQNFTLLEATQLKLYDVKSLSFRNPFTCVSGISFGEAVRRRLIDVSTTFVTESSEQRVYPVPEAIHLGLMDSVDGRVLDMMQDEYLTLTEAIQKGVVHEKEPTENG